MSVAVAIGEVGGIAEEEVVECPSYDECEYDDDECVSYTLEALRLLLGGCCCCCHNLKF